MGRHATASSRSSQKWQVAGNRNSEEASEVFRAAVDRPYHEEQIHVSSPSPNSTGGPNQPTLINKDDDRERWADIPVESDGEQAGVPGGKFRDDYANDAKTDEWSASSKKSGRARQKTRERERAAKKEALASPAVRSRDTYAASTSTVDALYRSTKGESKKSSHQEQYYESSNCDWDASAWGSTSSGWNTSKQDNSWLASSWDTKQDVVRPSESRKPRGEKNESFKRGAHVTTNMDASRLAW